MPRSSRSSGGGRSSKSSGGLFGRSSSNRAPPPAPVAPAPAPTHPPSSGGGGFMSNMVGNVAGGMASGVGFGVAQRALDGIMGPRQMEVVHSDQEVTASTASSGINAANKFENARSCNSEKEELNACLSHHSDIGLCQHYLDALRGCQTS
ncbi:CHCH domain-containing protein [Cardiosporidium cionae]|uniref:CHCH domain-containing protein n=1 Tax=Cardiosporidium cionae TaxID=476202 RepID=A0ABQ7JGP2_9APIC|nr:CHCH domain-containing protein [Cardiosporidium cionae]|eukprot:KAF8822850.1 CHCH domain-containing protein [Cardiosporidium cionae]